MKKGILKKFLAGILCVSMLTINDGITVAYAVETENIQEEVKTQESEEMDMDETGGQNESGGR